MKYKIFRSTAPWLFYLWWLLLLPSFLLSSQFHPFFPLICLSPSHHVPPPCSHLSLSIFLHFHSCFALICWRWMSDSQSLVSDSYSSALYWHSAYSSKKVCTLAYFVTSNKQSGEFFQYKYCSTNNCSNWNLGDHSQSYHYIISYWPVLKSERAYEADVVDQQVSEFPPAFYTMVWGVWLNCQGLCPFTNPLKTMQCGKIMCITRKAQKISSEKYWLISGQHKVKFTKHTKDSLCSLHSYCSFLQVLHGNFNLKKKRTLDANATHQNA